MSLASPRAFTRVTAANARQAIVDALATVPGVVPFHAAPDSATSGAAWPRWAMSTFHGERLGVVASHAYDVLVVLPAGYEPDTVDQGDGLLDQVASALYPVAEIDTAEPIQVTFAEGGVMPALRMRVTPRLNPTA